MLLLRVYPLVLYRQKLASYWIGLVVVGLILYVSLYQSVHKSELIRPSVEFMTKQEKIFRARTERLNNYCRTQKEGNSEIPSYTPKNILNLLQSRYVTFGPALPGNTLKRSFAFCAQGLSGYMGWMKVFQSLIEADNVFKSQLEVYKLYNERRGLENMTLTNMANTMPFPQLNVTASKELFSKSLSFTFVRHPYLRVVSMYQEFMITRQSNLILKTQTNFSREHFSSPFRPLPGLPSFREFIESYIEHNGFQSENWAFENHLQHCLMCQLDYLIGKVETLLDDVSYIMHKTGLDLHANEFPKRKLKQQATSIDSEELAVKYFSTISRNDFAKLKDFHWSYFVAFGYNPDLFSDLIETSPGFIR